jgi:HAD superfamily hydrolase (TIGR01484 family)
MKYKIVIFDIGKTLLDKRFSQRISEQTLNDITALKQKGIKIGVCTMRTVQHCREIIPFELDFYISLNGSHIVCDGDVTFDSPLHYQHNNNEYLSYGADFAFYSNEEAKQKALSNGFLIDQCGMADPVYNLVLFDIPKERLVDFSGFNVEYWENTQTIALQNADASKLIGIQRVLDYYKLEDSILYFGDGPNDLPIFQKFNDCVCMGDCYPKLIEHSLFQTKSCVEDGVSHALRKLEIL